MLQMLKMLKEKLFPISRLEVLHPFHQQNDFYDLSLQINMDIYVYETILILEHEHKCKLRISKEEMRTIFEFLTMISPVFHKSVSPSRLLDYVLKATFQNVAKIKSTWPHPAFPITSTKPIEFPTVKAIDLLISIRDLYNNRQLDTNKQIFQKNLIQLKEELGLVKVRFMKRPSL